MSLTKAGRAALHSKFDGRCAYCGEPLGARWHADHFEPLVRNDWLRCSELRGPQYPERDHVGNMMPACAPCNIDKHSLPLEGWRRKLADACGVLTRNQPTYRHAVRFGLVHETGAAVVFYFERVAELSRRHAVPDSRQLRLDGLHSP